MLGSFKYITRNTLNNLEDLKKLMIFILSRFIFIYNAKHCKRNRKKDECKSGFC